MGLTDTQSYSLVIRDGLFDAVSTDPFFASYTARKTKMLSVQHQLLPYLGVYIIEEQMLPDGDGNAGHIRFSHTLRIGFSVVVANNDQVAAEAQIDAAWWRIMNRLWPDQKLMNVVLSSLPDNTMIESLPRGVRRHVFGAAGLNNETPVAELQYDVSIFFRSGWPPIITDDLNTIDVVTGIKPGDSQADMDQRQQIHVQYQFDQLRKAMKRETKQ
ncbi:MULTISPECIES: hypothetical protein [Bradyrhizobium]|uniref:Uncharacterized protein n=1 Tax=Bradyrhizobium septentrionale TaxID=1404411 RepID=A0A973W5I3_9BRAD|nr:MULTISPECIES: hypothetical protein [Bradyrhizobium]QIG93812.1 hypothetical protein G6P99_15810 [Bradyrhizobium sp. 6(2017)]UGY12520.1 hypothetical protein HAP48_0028285 [Bradyrhizobium septentrionale]UGY16362.1 hypothetical protein HAP48_0002000 [Bradyrhizobium septentrionale]